MDILHLTIPLPFFLDIRVALRTSFSISPKLNAFNNGVGYLYIVLVSSPFDFQKEEVQGKTPCKAVVGVIKFFLHIK